MAKYITVEIAQSVIIRVRESATFFRRTLPASKNAKPPCIEKTRTAPHRTKKTLPVVEGIFDSFPVVHGKISWEHLGHAVGHWLRIALVKIYVKSARNTRNYRGIYGVFTYPFK